MTFSTEADLCAAFLSALPEEWTPYPETAGFDILLVGPSGFQIGIEAKLRLNAKVVDQATEDFYDVCRAGPDCRAVLVPSGKAGGFGRVCRLLGITVLEVTRRNEFRLDAHKGEHWQFTPRLPLAADRSWRDDWHEWMPVERCRLPDYVPDVAAGASAPVRLTDWKVKAIKICVLIERRGYVTRADFKALNLDHRRWINPHVAWLQFEAGGYVRGPHFPDLRREHPVNFAQIETDFDRWAPPQQPRVFQEAML